MHPLAQEPDLTVLEAAILIAFVNGGDATIPGWRKWLNEDIKHGELPTHDRAVPDLMFLAGLSRGTHNEPHLWREDIQAFCERRRIRSPYPPAPKKKTRAVDKKNAAFDQWKADQDPHVLGRMKRADVVGALMKVEPFSTLERGTVETYWKLHGQKRMTAAHATSPKSPRKRNRR